MQEAARGEAVDDKIMITLNGINDTRILWEIKTWDHFADRWSYMEKGKTNDEVSALMEIARNMNSIMKEAIADAKAEARGNSLV